MWSFMKFIIPFLGDDYCFAYLNITDYWVKVAFGPEPNTIIIVS